MQWEQFFLGSLLWYEGKKRFGVLDVGDILQMEGGAATKTCL